MTHERPNHAPHRTPKLPPPYATSCSAHELRGDEHAGGRCAADQRQALEHLCRYITRPAIANERRSVNHAGQVVLKLKTPYRDGTSHIVMSPLEKKGPPCAIAAAFS